MSLASGFFVEDQTIITNAHVIEGSSTGYAKLVGQQEELKVAGLVGIDAARDLALLRVSGKSAIPVKLGDSALVNVGDVVYAVGNPLGLEGTFSDGIISSIRKVGTNSLLQITAPISPGSSGGPVLDKTGTTIGVATATISGGQNLNFAIPISYVKSLMSSQSSLFPLSALTKVHQKASIFHDWGRPSREGIVAEHFLWGDALGMYSFSLRNQLKQNVRNIRCRVVFYEQSGSPVEAEAILFADVVPAGLAKRVTHGSGEPSNASKGLGVNITLPLMVDESVRRLTNRVEIRVLDFTIEQ